MILQCYQLAPPLTTVNLTDLPQGFYKADFTKLCKTTFLRALGNASCALHCRGGVTLSGKSVICKHHQTAQSWDCLSQCWVRNEVRELFPTKHRHWKRTGILGRLPWVKVSSPQHSVHDGPCDCGVSSHRAFPPQGFHPIWKMSL